MPGGNDDQFSVEVLKGALYSPKSQGMISHGKHYG
jgi:hypothetical protein